MNQDPELFAKKYVNSLHGYHSVAVKLIVSTQSSLKAKHQTIIIERQTFLINLLLN